MDLQRFEVRNAQRGLGDGLPELAQTRDALLGRIAGDQRRVDRADRDSRDPIGMKIVLGERLIDPGLIGTERATALQHQHHLFEFGLLTAS